MVGVGVGVVELDGVGVGVIYKKQREGYTFNYTTNNISVGLYKKLF
jgi:hypothetical protein